jgi:hypothetical protein
MRTQSNRQTVSSTARWNLVQSDPASPGAQKRPLANEQTGKGSNLLQLQRALASAELHLSQTYDPRLQQNIAHGITVLKAQMARITGVDVTHFDVHSVPDSPTGYQFAGFVDATETESVAVASDATMQSPISSFAQFQLAGTLRQKISNVSPPANATPAGSLKHPGVNPLDRSNVMRTPNNPDGSAFPTGTPGSHVGFHPQSDNRNNEYRGAFYRQDDPSLHINVHTGRGVVPSAQKVARGKHGQYRGGYKYQSETPQSTA